MPSIQTAPWMRYNPFATSFATPMGSIWGSTGKVPFWGLQAVKKTPTIPKIPLPTFGTTAKVAGTGAIVYTGYKGVQGIGKTFDDFFGTGMPPEPGKTKKETKTGADDTIFPPAPEGTPTVNYYYQQAAEPQGFYGGLGSGLGKGAEGVGAGTGSGLSMAIPVLAVGGLAYFLLKEKKGHKK